MNKLSKILLGILVMGCSMEREKPPERYDDLITQNEYDIIVRHSVEFLKERGTVVKIEDGVIYVELENDPENIMQLALDNLLRNCKQEEDKGKWKEIIIDHFARLTTNTDLDKSDFNKCRDLLTIRIYPEYDDKTKAIMIFQVDFPGTMSTLALDLPDKYETIDKEIIDLWRVPVDSLFRIAQENVNKREGLEIVEAKDVTRIYSFFSPDHSASFIRDIEQNAGFAIGEFGAFVAIPTTGSAFVIPIDDKTAIDDLDKLRPTIKPLYDEDPGSITNEIFWYDTEAFKLIPIVGNEIVLPKELKKKILE